MKESNSKFHISLIGWHKKTFRKIARLIALLISITFLFPYLIWAFDAGSYAMPKAGKITVQHLGKFLYLPKKLGAIHKGFQGQEKMVVHIQDLHCNYEVQKNIAAMIHHLAKEHDLRLVGEEGAFHTVNTTKLSTFPVKKVREEVSDYFVKQGKLAGAEFYAATGEYPIQLEGIETPALYTASEKAVHSFLNQESLGYCYDLREILDELKDSIYHPELKQFDAQRVAFRQGDTELLKYCAHLHQTAQKLKVNLTPYFNLSCFLSANKNIFSQKVDTDGLFQEVDFLDRTIREQLYTHKIQLELDQLYRRLDIIEKLLNISATPEELQEFRAQREKYSMKEFANFINTVGARCLSDIALAKSDAVPLQPDPEMYILDEYLQAVEDFYQLADERSAHFVDNLTRKMDQFNEQLAVMITGGFHTAEVLAELQRRNISYVSVKPRLSQQDIVNPYFSLLRNKRTPLEKLLARNQNILSLRTNCVDSPFKSKKQLTFSRQSELFMESCEVVELKRQGCEIQAIPEAMRKILREYPANESIGVDLNEFVKANPVFSQKQGRVLVIPTTVTTEKGLIKAIAVLDEKISIPNELTHDIQRININGQQFFLCNSKNIPLVIEEVLKNQQSILVILPEGVPIEKFFGAYGIMVRTARSAVERRSLVSQLPALLPDKLKSGWVLIKKIKGAMSFPLPRLVEKAFAAKNTGESPWVFAGVAPGLASIFYNYYLEGKIENPQTWRNRLHNLRYWLGEPLQGAPSWELIFSLPLLYAAFYGWEWPLLIITGIAYAWLFSRGHPEASQKEKNILLGVGLGLGYAAILPSLLAGPSLLAVLYGGGLNILLHSAYNSLALRFDWPVASLPTARIISGVNTPKKILARLSKLRGFKQNKYEAMRIIIKYVIGNDILLKEHIYEERKRPGNFISSLSLNTDLPEAEIKKMIAEYYLQRVSEYKKAGHKKYNLINEFSLKAIKLYLEAGDKIRAFEEHMLLASFYRQNKKKEAAIYYARAADMVNRLDIEKEPGRIIYFWERLAQAAEDMEDSSKVEYFKDKMQKHYQQGKQELIKGANQHIESVNPDIIAGIKLWKKLEKLAKRLEDVETSKLAGGEILKLAEESRPKLLSHADKLVKRDDYIKAIKLLTRAKKELKGIGHSGDFAVSCRRKIDEIYSVSSIKLNDEVEHLICIHEIIEAVILLDSKRKRRNTDEYIKNIKRIQKLLVRRLNNNNNYKLDFVSEASAGKERKSVKKPIPLHPKSLKDISIRIGSESKKTVKHSKDVEKYVLHRSGNVILRRTKPAEFLPEPGKPAGLLKGVASIFYNYYLEGKIENPQTWRNRLHNLRYWLGEPLQGAPSWELIFSLPLLYAAFYGWEWPLLIITGIAYAWLFSRGHPEASQKEKNILLGVGLGLGYAAILPSLLAGPSLLAVVYGGGLNVLLHSAYNSLALRFGWPVATVLQEREAAAKPDSTASNAEDVWKYLNRRVKDMGGQKGVKSIFDLSERLLLIKAWENAGYDQATTAGLVKLSPRSLRYELGKYNIVHPKRHSANPGGQVELSESDEEALAMLLSVCNVDKVGELFKRANEKASVFQLVNRLLIIKALEETYYRQQDAAKLMGISAKILNYNIKKYKITYPRWRKNQGKRDGSLYPIIESTEYIEHKAKAIALEVKERLAKEEIKEDVLLERSQALKKQVKKSGLIDENIIEGLVLFGSAYKNATGNVLKEYQLEAAVCLSRKGAIALEQAYGSGKTEDIIAAAYLNFLQGKKIEIHVAEDYLARSQGRKMGKIFRSLGITTGIRQSRGSQYIINGKGESPRSSINLVYGCDIIIGLNTLLYNDYIQDQLCLELSEKKRPYALPDKVFGDDFHMYWKNQGKDLTIFGTRDKHFKKAALLRTIWELINDSNLKLVARRDYSVLEESKGIYLKAVGQKKIRNKIMPALIKTGLWSKEATESEIFRMVREALQASLYEEGEDYIVDENNEVTLLCPYTMTPQPGKRWADGDIFNFVTFKHKGSNPARVIPANFISSWDYYRNIEDLAILDGRLNFIDELQVYRPFRFFKIAADTEDTRTMHGYEIWKDEETKRQAIYNQIIECHNKGMPVIIGTKYIKTTKELAEGFKKYTAEKYGKHYSFNVYTGTEGASGDKIIANATKKGTITFASAALGVGIDTRAKRMALILGESMSEDAEAQYAGRVGRMEDMADVFRHVSCADELVKFFGKDLKKKLLEKYEFNKEGLLPIPEEEAAAFIKEIQNRAEKQAVWQRRLARLRWQGIEESREIYFQLKNFLMCYGADKNALQKMNKLWSGYFVTALKKSGEINVNAFTEEMAASFEEMIGSIFVTGDNMREKLEELLQYHAAYHEAYKGKKNKILQEVAEIIISQLKKSDELQKIKLLTILSSTGYRDIAITPSPAAEKETAEEPKTDLREPLVDMRLKKRIKDFIEKLEEKYSDHGYWPAKGQFFSCKCYSLNGLKVANDKQIELIFKALSNIFQYQFIHFTRNGNKCRLGMDVKMSEDNNSIKFQLFGGKIAEQKLAALFGNNTSWQVLNLSEKIISSYIDSLKTNMRAQTTYDWDETSHTIVIEIPIKKPDKKEVQAWRYLYEQNSEEQPGDIITLAKRLLIILTMQRTKYNREKTAQLLGMDNRSLSLMLKQYYGEINRRPELSNEDREFLLRFLCLWNADSTKALFARAEKEQKTLFELAIPILLINAYKQADSTQKEAAMLLRISLGSLRHYISYYGVNSSHTFDSVGLRVAAKDPFRITPRAVAGGNWKWLQQPMVNILEKGWEKLARVKLFKPLAGWVAGLSPPSRESWERFYDKWLAFWQENGLSLIGSGIVVGLPAIYFMHGDLTMAAQYAYLWAWPLFFVLHFLRDSQGKRASPGDIALAGIISIINIALGFSSFSWPSIIALSFFSHFAVNLTAPAIAAYVSKWWQQIKTAKPDSAAILIPDLYTSDLPPGTKVEASQNLLLPPALTVVQVIVGWVLPRKYTSLSSAQIIGNQELQKTLAKIRFQNRKTLPKFQPLLLPREIGLAQYLIGLFRGDYVVEKKGSPLMIYFPHKVLSVFVRTVPNSAGHTRITPWLHSWSKSMIIHIIVYNKNQRSRGIRKSVSTDFGPFQRTGPAGFSNQIERLFAPVRPLLPERMRTLLLTGLAGVIWVVRGPISRGRIWAAAGAFGPAIIRMAQAKYQIHIIRSYLTHPEWSELARELNKQVSHDPDRLFYYMLKHLEAHKNPENMDQKARDKYMAELQRWFSGMRPWISGKLHTLEVDFQGKLYQLKVPAVGCAAAVRALRKMGFESISIKQYGQQRRYFNAAV